MKSVTTHRLLLAAIEARDSLALQVFADWLDEHGEDGESWRLLGESGKWPNQQPPVDVPRYLPRARRKRKWFWMNGGNWPTFSNDLPGDVFKAMLSSDDMRGHFTGHRTLLAALTAAASAYLQVNRTEART